MNIYPETPETLFENRVLITKGYFDTYYGDFYMEDKPDNKYVIPKTRVLINDEYGDYLKQLYFTTLDEAIEYCTEQGFENVYYRLHK